MSIHWDRAIIGWLGVIPIALLSTLLYRVWSADLLGYPVLPSLLLIAYIFAALFWMTGDDDEPSS